LGQGVDRTWNLVCSLNGILAGLVAITAPCATVEPWGAFVIGCTAAAAYFWGSKLMVKMRIDDPLDACVVHGICGAWGLLCVGLFSSSNNIRGAFRSPPSAWVLPDGTQYEVTSYGLLLGGGWGQLGIQLVGVLLIFSWTSIWSLATFTILNKLGILRISAPHEKKSFQSRLDELSQKKAIRELAYEEKYESGTETPLTNQEQANKKMGRGEIRVVEDPDSEDDTKKNEVKEVSLAMKTQERVPEDDSSSS